MPTAMGGILGATTLAGFMTPKEEEEKFNNDEYYGFIVGENWDFKIPEDCEEITVSEYNKLFK